METAKLAFANPVRLFEHVPDEDIGPAVLYGVIIGSVGIVIGGIWQVLFGGLTGLVSGAGAGELALSTTFTVLFMLFSPLFAALGLFVAAGVYHLMLLLLGDGSRGFGVTLKAVAYGSTPNLLAAVPFCGGIVGGLWGMVLTIIGAVYGQRTEAWRAIVAYFLPLVLCCSLAFATATMFGLLGALAGH